jgi:hypothetical protein
LGLVLSFARNLPRFRAEIAQLPEWHCRP